MDEKGRAYADLINSPELAAHRIVSLMQPSNYAEGIDAPGMLATLRDQATAVQRGDLAHAEAMLSNQASALQAVFVRLSERAMAQSHMPNLEAFLRLALRAQSQCRATLETLAAIKNPPVVIARQANVTTGPQQVNNGVAAPRAGEFEREDQSHALGKDAGPGQANASSPALLSQQQAVGLPLPSASGKGKARVPDARSQGRGADGKGQRPISPRPDDPRHDR